MRFSILSGLDWASDGLGNEINAKMRIKKYSTIPNLDCISHPLFQQLLMFGSNRSSLRSEALLDHPVIF
jgi:hypothetical protein